MRKVYVRVIEGMDYPAVVDKVNDYIAEFVVKSTVFHHIQLGAGAVLTRVEIYYYDDQKPLFAGAGVTSTGGMADEENKHVDPIESGSVST